MMSVIQGERGEPWGSWGRGGVPPRAGPLREGGGGEEQQRKRPDLHVGFNRAPFLRLHPWQADPLRHVGVLRKAFLLIWR